MPRVFCAGLKNSRTKILDVLNRYEGWQWERNSKLFLKPPNKLT